MKEVEEGGKERGEGKEEGRNNLKGIEVLHPNIKRLIVEATNFACAYSAVREKKERQNLFKVCAKKEGFFRLALSHT